MITQSEKTEEVIVLPEAHLSYEAWVALMTAEEKPSGAVAELREQLRNPRFEIKKEE